MPLTIENPILNSPFEAPARHWRITDDGITDEPVVGRRSSSYFIPVPPPRKKGGLLSLDGFHLSHGASSPWLSALPC